MLDCVFRGNASIPYGLVALNPSGLKVERSEFFNFTDVGLRLSDNVTVSFGGSTPIIEAVRDILVDTVTRATPGSVQRHRGSGTDDRTPVANAVERVKVRNVVVVRPAGREQRLAHDVPEPRHRHDRAARSTSSVGVYLEHYSYENTFERFSVAARVGFNAEWADPAWGGRAGGTQHDHPQRRRRRRRRERLEERRRASTSTKGTESTTVTDVVFRAQNWAGVGAYKNVGTNAFGANTYQVDAGASQITYSHINGARPASGAGAHIGAPAPAEVRRR